MSSYIEEISDDKMDQYTCEQPRVIEPDNSHDVYENILEKYINRLYYLLDNEFKCKDEYIVLVSPTQLDHLKYKHEVDMFNVHDVIDNVVNTMFNEICDRLTCELDTDFMRAIQEKVYRDINNAAQPMIQEYIRQQHL